MSRICGLIFPEDAAMRHELLRAMLERMRERSHRRERVLHGGRCALGWTGCTMSNAAERGGILAVVDGSIFNRQDLGEYPSDAALLLDYHERYGFVDALERLNGDFAVAVYDVPRGVLWLGRDRLGVKPLYWTRVGRRFAFASRPAVLLPLPGVDESPSPRFLARFAASHYRVFDNDPEASAYASISQLPAGTAMRVTEEGQRLCRWWQVVEQPEFTVDRDALAQRYRELLFDAVDIRLSAAVKPAFTLSGGMDSSSVLGVATRDGRVKQAAFSTTYDDKTFDECDDILPMAEQSVSSWHKVGVNGPDVFPLVRQMVAAHDEPVATATWLSHWLLCQEARRLGFQTLFGGLGGDELNAGEYEYFPYHFADINRKGSHAELAREIAGWVQYHNHPVYQKSTAIAVAVMERLTDESVAGKCLPDMARITRYRDILEPDFAVHLDALPEMENPFANYLKNRTWQDLTRETMPCCLRASDRHAAAFGMEAMHPFLDYRLAEFMYRVPNSMKIQDGVTKKLLRHAMRGILPEETRTRVAKTGWNAPAHVWFAGEDGDRLMDMVRGRRFRERGIYDAAAVERLVREHREIVGSGQPKENHMMLLWQVVNLEVWLDGLSAFGRKYQRGEALVHEG